MNYQNKKIENTNNRWLEGDPTMSAMTIDPSKPRMEERTGSKPLDSRRLSWMIMMTDRKVDDDRTKGYDHQVD